MADVKTKKRIIYLDYLRVLAIFGVLLNHISANWEGGELINSSIALLYNSFGRIGVPLFLMLTGVLLLNNKLPIKDFIKRRYPRVIIPFLFWMTLLILYMLFVLNPSLLNENILEFAIVHYLSDRWYVWMILGVYLIIPIIASFIKGTKMEGVKYFLIIWLITTALITLSMVFDFSLHYLDLVIFSGPIGYLMLGYYLHNKEISMSPKKVVSISLFVFILFTVIKTFILSQDVVDPYAFRYFIFTMKSRLEIDTVSIVQVAALFLIVKYMPKVTSGIYQKITKFCNKEKVLLLIISISQASYGIYLNHYFITNTLKTYHFPFASLPSIIFVPLLAIIVLLLAYAIIMVLNRVPVINKLTGYH
ncbi:acyltransferase family protein [Methanobrevibacter sp.]|uniref:acyltransferase n=1 Tax=Methanobrevibacter sp. TaxID=66852 RepID=UPI0025E7863A|nr:acyltransferase family protein [Methanobrevibacter sp.]MBQ2666050.1 acyltransferase family protein [Methanobrevibacter sp.]